MELIEELTALRALYGAPMDIAVRKSLPQLDPHCRNFIRLSPFLLISTQGPDGADVSPRGDAAGFVTVLDEKTLLIPDRPGNNRIDTLENILHNPVVGVLILVPGLGEAMRINGRAAVVTGPEMATLAHSGKVPKAAIRVTVQEAFFHCAKAIIRARLWDAATQVPKSAFPPLGRVIADQVAGLNAQTTTEGIERAYQTALY
jgi:uncharacterized protein